MGPFAIRTPLTMMVVRDVPEKACPRPRPRQEGLSVMKHVDQSLTVTVSDGDVLMYDPFLRFRNSNPAFLSFSPTLPVISLCCSTDLRFYNMTVSVPHIESIIMEAGYHTLDCSYPDSFVLTKCSDFFIRLSLLSCEELSTCTRNFRGNIPRGS